MNDFKFILEDTIAKTKSLISDYKNPRIAYSGLGSIENIKRKNQVSEVMCRASRESPSIRVCAKYQ